MKSRAARSTSGAVLALSGLDSSGKSTQRKLLLEELTRRGLSPVYSWTRLGYTARLHRGKRLLSRLLGGKQAARKRGARSPEPGQYPRRAESLRNPVMRWLWLGVATLELLWIYAIAVRVYRARGRTVLCDRYLLDNLVDLRVNFPRERILGGLIEFLLRKLSTPPDAAFCIVIPAEESVRRSKAHERYHWETLEIVEQRRCAYESLGRELGVTLVDGTRSSEEIAAILLGGIKTFGDHVAPVTPPTTAVSHATVVARR